MKIWIALPSRTPRRWCVNHEIWRSAGDGDSERALDRVVQRGAGFHHKSWRVGASAEQRAVVEPTEKGARLRVQDSGEEFDYAVLAVPFDSLAKLLPESQIAQDLREKLSHFETAPITGVHLWFDRQITDLPHAVLLDRTIQWMFHKSLLLEKHPVATSNPGNGAGEREERPSYVELVISASKSLIESRARKLLI